MEITGAYAVAANWAILCMPFFVFFIWLISPWGKRWRDESE
jgi:hypothetical protein